MALPAAASLAPAAPAAVPLAVAAGETATAGASPAGYCSDALLVEVQGLVDELNLNAPADSQGA